MTDIKELKQEADELGIKYSPNIGASTLKEKIDAFYESQKSELPTLEETESTASTSSGWTDADRRKLAAEREKAAKETRVVTIVNNDQRTNNHTTSVTVNCSNDYFDLGTVILPLNVPVEVMKGHLDVLESVEIPMHVQVRGGLNKVEVRKQYSISYEDKK